MRNFYIRHLRVSRAWHDMTHHDTLWPGQVPVGSDIWGSARWSEAPRFGCPTRTRRPSQTFHIFPIIPYHFATLLYIWKRSTVANIDKTSCFCWAAAALDFDGFCIIPQFKFGQTSWIWGLVNLVGVQGAHSQREERRNDDERLGNSSGIWYALISSQLKCQKPQLKSDTLTYQSQQYNFAWLVQWPAVNYTMSVDK